MGTRTDQSNPKKMIIGIIGGIGSGKSEIAEYFAKKGGKLIQADKLGHEAHQQEHIRQMIVQRWGERVLDEQNQLDRKKLGSIVFASAVERANLEMMVFPWIEQRIRQEIKEADDNPSYQFVVLDAAIMVEAKWNKICSKMVYVHTPRYLRLQRLINQRGWSQQELFQRETAQLTLTEKATLADVAIDNSHSIEASQKQIDRLLTSWQLANECSVRNY